MWLMLQQDKPEDFVVGTGKAHSVKEFLQLSCKAADIDNWEAVYKHNPAFDRPAEVDQLIADPKKTQEKLGWKPSVTFEELVTLMVKAEIERENKISE